MKRGLQGFLGIASIIPLLVSVSGLIFGTSRALPAELVTPAFDSQFRYLIGYYLSLSLFAWWVIPNIEKQVIPLRVISLSVFIGGTGRVISILEVGLPPAPQPGVTVFELCFPLVLFWQAQIPRQAVSSQEG